MRVLIVDDSMLIRLQLKAFFEEHLSAEVVGLGANGRDAIALYEKKVPDLVILDLNMPVMGGKEAIREILKLAPNARILICSAIADRAEITETLMMGAKTFISKPLQFDNQEFIDTFKEDVEEALKS